MRDARFDEILEAYERRLAASTSRERVALLFREFSSAVGLAGRSDPSVPMVGGVVVPAAVWAAYKPRVEQLAGRFTERLDAFGAQALADQRRAHARTLRVFFPVELENVDTDERLEDEALLARCHGLRADADLGETDLGGPPVLHLLADAVLEFDEARGALACVFRLPLAVDPTKAQTETILELVRHRLERTWCLNHPFALPPELGDYALHLKPIAARWELGAR